MGLAALAELHTPHDFVDVLRHSLLITAFVFMMMLVIEYLNVLTRGAWQHKLTRHRWRQYALTAALGATPGCLGAFAVVAMYSHRTITLGAVVTGMIATCGDEAFVLLAKSPGHGLLVIGILFALSIPLGILTDLVFGRRMAAAKDGEVLFEVHEEHCFARGEIVRQWKECTAARGILAAALVVFLLAVVSGQIEPHDEVWLRVTLIAVTAIAFFIVATVPDHLLDEHLWKHVAREHVLRVFLWTLGAMLTLFFLLNYLDPEHVVHEERLAWILLAAACLIGLIPQSGPHVAFVLLFAEGVAPFSVLLASCIVQNGHAPLPLLAHSRRAFLGVKAITFIVGAIIGAVLLAFGL